MHPRIDPRIQCPHLCEIMFVCPACGESFLLSKGVVIDDMLYKEGTTLHFGRMYLCSAVCFLRHCNVRGTG